jgi:hypothetical protein
MFNEKVLAVLGQINGITDTAIIKYPTTVTYNEDQDVAVCFDVSKLDGDQFPEIPLFNNLSKFLNTIKLFKKPTFSFTDNQVVISDGVSSAELTLDNKALMEAYDKDDTQFKRSMEIPSVAEFDLSVNDIGSLKSACNVFKELEHITITSKDGDVYISLDNTTKFNSKSSSYNIKKTAETSKEFSISLPVKKFVKLPPSDYVVRIKYNSARDSYRVIFDCKTISLQVMMAIIAK